MDIFNRTELIIGKEGLKILQNAHVALFGLGGVGGYALEALVRSGVGNIDLIDRDVIDETNLNRQIISLSNNIGKDKTEAAEERALSINPYINIITHKMFYLPETADLIDLSQYDYIVDCIDTVTAKLELIQRAERAEIPIISSMGTGNKLKPQLLQVADIYETKVCPLAKVMRKELKQRGIKKLKVIYSTEEPVIRGKLGSMAATVGTAGFLIAGEVINDLLINKAGEQK